MIWEPGSYPEGSGLTALSDLDIATIRDRETQEKLMNSTVMSLTYFFGCCLLGLAIIAHYV